MKKFWNKLKKGAITANQVQSDAVKIGLPVPVVVQSGFKAAELIASMFKKKDK